MLDPADPTGGLKLTWRDEPAKTAAISGKRTVAAAENGHVGRTALSLSTQELHLSRSMVS